MIFGFKKMYQIYIPKAHWHKMSGGQLHCNASHLCWAKKSRKKRELKLDECLCFSISWKTQHRFFVLCISAGEHTTEICVYTLCLLLTSSCTHTYTLAQCNAQFPLSPRSSSTFRGWMTLLLLSMKRTKKNSRAFLHAQMWWWCIGLHSHTDMTLMHGLFPARIASKLIVFASFSLALTSTRPGCRFIWFPHVGEKQNRVKKNHISHANTIQPSAGIYVHIITNNGESEPAPY